MKHMKQKNNNIVWIKGINLINGNIRFGPKIINDIFLKTNINKSERNKTPKSKLIPNVKKLFKSKLSIS